MKLFLNLHLSLCESDERESEGRGTHRKLCPLWHAYFHSVISVLAVLGRNRTINLCETLNIQELDWLHLKKENVRMKISLKKKVEKYIYI